MANTKGRSNKIVLVLSVINKWCPPLVAGSTVLCAITHQTDLFVIMLVCAVLNALLGKILKILIGKRRPENSKKQTYGMPSSHANCLSFFVAYLTMAATDILSLYDAVLVCVSSVVYTLCVCYYRACVSRDHTALQILGGFVHGVLAGWVSYTVVLPWYSTHKEELYTLVGGN